MATTHTPESLNRLYRDLGYQPLSHWWGRAEIFLGLLTTAVSLFTMLYLGVYILYYTNLQREVDIGLLIGPGIGAAFLFALGGYLALAGHRRHLYESNDRLTAYLADLVRPQADRPVVASAAPTVNGPAPQSAGTGFRPSESPA